MWALWTGEGRTFAKLARARNGGVAVDRGVVWRQLSTHLNDWC